ncbi:MAG: hypothetical protein WD317_08300 [Balneolaceae bacterium]
MTSIRSYTIGLILFSLYLSAPAIAQVTGEPAEPERGVPLIYKFDARTAALANATVAESGAVSAVNINPATLSFVRNTQSVQLNTYQNWDSNLMLQNITFPALIRGEHRVAAQFGYHHRGFEATNVLGAGPSPMPDIMMYQADVAYAYSIENILSVGVFNNITFAQNEYARFWSYFANLGVLYAPSESVSYGIALRGLGRSITYELHESNRTLLGSQGLRQSLELGATLQFPVEVEDSYVSLSLANEKRFGENGIWYKGGLEIKPIPVLALRSGILYHPVNRIQIPRFGTGLLLDSLRLDYSFSYRNLPNERFHQLGLTIYL